MNCLLLTNKYGQVSIDDLTIKSYVAKSMMEKFPHLAISTIKLEQINPDLNVLTILLAAHQGVEINDFGYISDWLCDHLYNNLRLNLKCINIGYSNYGSK